ncbi:putative reverse transcriptase domain-containing protein [Tanacetum coccineum]
MLNRPLEDEEEMEEFKEEEKEPQEEEEFEDEMDMDGDEAMDGPEIIHPYEEVDPLNPPPGLDSEPEDVIVPTSRLTLQLLPPIHRFSGNFYVGEGSSSDASVVNHRKVFAPGPLGKDVNALHNKVKSLTQQMKDRAETEFSNLKRLANVDRDEIQRRNQMQQMVTELGKQVQELQEDDVRKENKKLKMVLESTRNDLARRPRDTTTVLVAHLDPDDPYGSATTGVPSPELRGSLRNAGGPANGTEGQAGAPVVRECSLTRFMKCNPTVFHGNEGAVATLGIEAANRTTWTKMKRLMTEEFCPTKEIQRMEYELWNLKVKDFNISAYTQRFNRLALLCPTMVPTDHTSYEVELADGKSISTNTVLRGCTLNLVNHLFEIDLMPIGLGTFDVIIGMDWLVEHDAVIVYARKYIERGCQLFLAQVIEKEPAERSLKDVPVIPDFPEVFPDDLPGLPPPRQMEFRIELVPEAVPVARAPYH